MSLKDSWDEDTQTIDKKLVRMDGFILKYKLKNKTFNGFLKDCGRIMTISDSEGFKKAYWDKDFLVDWLRKAENIYKTEKKLHEYISNVLDMNISVEEMRELLI